MANESWGHIDLTLLLVGQSSPFEVGGKMFHPERSKVVADHVIEELIKGVSVEEAKKISVA